MLDMQAAMVAMHHVCSTIESETELAAQQKVYTVVVVAAAGVQRPAGCAALTPLPCVCWNA
jgi:hypothetical protein